tara:strand:+ start:1739 stop:2725 length:987 start_codon:yes stop_codon:yes gene_type:complete
MNKILITGTAGFIGSEVTKIFLKSKKIKICGVDNLNSYYDKKLKLKRLKQFHNDKNYIHFTESIENKKKIDKIFKKFKPNIVINLAAQAGVRYAMKNPYAYKKSNLDGFINLMELCKKYSIKYFFYASSSSVYGQCKKFPLKEKYNTDNPISLYAATKKSNEIVANSYSHLYGIYTCGLRFFTVYGPWGRPDMALFKFTKHILENKAIEVFNYGKHKRDFTYIDDIVTGVFKIITNRVSNKNFKKKSEIYNLGNGRPQNLMKFIRVIEEELGKKAIIKFKELQPGDVPETFADINLAKKNFNYKPKINIEIGVKNFISWYKKFYAKNK